MGEELFAIVCAIKKQSSQATFVGTKLFTISCIGFCLFRILILFYIYIIRSDMQIIGILPILEESTGYSTLIDVTCNLFYIDLMIRFAHMSLHKVNSHPLIFVVNEKVDVFVNTIWPIVILSLSSVVSVFCFIMHLITASILLYILVGLFCLFDILILLRWIQYYKHAKRILQNSLIPTSTKKNQLISMTIWVSIFILSRCAHAGLLIFTLFTPIIAHPIEVIYYTLVDVFQSLKATETYQSYFNDITAVLGDVISV